MVYENLLSQWNCCTGQEFSPWLCRLSADYGGNKRTK